MGYFRVLTAIPGLIVSALLLLLLWSVTGPLAFTSMRLAGWQRRRRTPILMDSRGESSPGGELLR